MGPLSTSSAIHARMNAYAAGSGLSLQEGAMLGASRLGIGGAPGSLRDHRWGVMVMNLRWLNLHRRGRGGIFICYRRAETAANAGRLYDRLSERFGEDRVFMDI